MADQKVWFITGVSRGFGRVLTECAVAHNDIVVGTTRDGRASFTGDTRNVRVLPLELTDPAAIRATIAKAPDFLSDRSIRNIAAEIEDYAPTAGATQAALAKMAGHQIGDPSKAASAIFQITRESQPPLHLLLGSDALRRTRENQAQLSADIQRWETLTLGTDFPKGT